MRPIHIADGTALIDGALTQVSLTLDDGKIAGIGDSAPRGALTIDARGLLVLPGIVDIHGDAFERQIMPRPGVRFPYALALADTDRQLAAAGITTAYHGLTLSWEPGLRSVDSAGTFMQALAEERSRLSVDHRIQLRLETFVFDAEDVVARCLDVDPKPTLAFNDHTSTTAGKLAEGKRDQLPQWALRCGLSEEDYLQLFEEVWKRRPEVRAFIGRVAARARAADVVMLSHDDRTLEDRAFYRARGVSVAEFPLTIEAIDDAVRRGEPTVLGAPNVVRGGSHTGALNAADMIEKGCCTILASDYHYPSMLAAIGHLVAKRGQSLEDAWRLISEAPAEAAGLDDRGRLAPGLRADLALVEFGADRPPWVTATLAGGKLAFLAGHDRIA